MTNQIDAPQATFEPEGPAPSATADPLRKIRNFASDHPAVVIAGGLAIGALTLALLPKKTGGKFARRALAAAAAAGEIGLAVSRQARDKAEEATRDGRELMVDGAEKARRGTARAASSAGKAGLDLARAAVKLAASARR